MWSIGSFNMEFTSIFLLSILAIAVAYPSQGQPPQRPNCIKMTPEKEQQIDLIVEKLGQFLNTLSIEHEHFDIRLLKLAIEQHTDDEEEKETVLQLSVNDCQLSEDELDEIDHHKEKVEHLEKEKEAEKDREIEQERDGKDAALKKEEESKEKIKALEDKVKALTKELENITNSREKTEINKTEEVDKINNQPEEKIENNDKDIKLQNRDCDGTPEINHQKDNESNAKAISVEDTNENNPKNSFVEGTNKNIANPISVEDAHENKAEAGSVEGTREDSNNEGEVKPEIMYLDLDENGQRLVKAIGRKKNAPIVVYVQKNSGQTEHWFLKR